MLSLSGSRPNLLLPSSIFSDDVLIGTETRDLALALFGDDLIETGAGDDIVLAGFGDDIIAGGTDDGILSVRLLADLGDPFAGRALPVTLGETLVDPAAIAGTGGFSLLAANGTTAILEPCFFVGDVRLAQDGDVIATVLVDGGQGLVGILEPCFIVADTAAGRIEIDLEPVRPDDGGAFGLVLNLGVDPRDTIGLSITFMDAAGNTEVLESELELPGGPGAVPTLTDMVVADTVVGGDLLSGGFGDDFFFYDPHAHGVDTIVDFALGEDVVGLAGILEPCFLPHGDGTLVAFMAPGDSTIVPNAGLILEGLAPDEVAAAGIFVDADPPSNIFA